MTFYLNFPSFRINEIFLWLKNGLKNSFKRDRKVLRILLSVKSAAFYQNLLSYFKVFCKVLEFFGVFRTSGINYTFLGHKMGSSIVCIHKYLVKKILLSQNLARFFIKICCLFFLNHCDFLNVSLSMGKKTF